MYVYYTRNIHTRIYNTITHTYRQAHINCPHSYLNTSCIFMYAYTCESALKCAIMRMVSIGTVSHTHTHTHTQVVSSVFSYLNIFFVFVCTRIAERYIYILMEALCSHHAQAWRTYMCKFLFSLSYMHMEIRMIHTKWHERTLYEETCTYLKNDDAIMAWGEWTFACFCLHICIHDISTHVCTVKTLSLPCPHTTSHVAVEVGMSIWISGLQRRTPLNDYIQCMPMWMHNVCFLCCFFFFDDVLLDRNGH
jgi:hypothetical protein